VSEEIIVLQRTGVDMVNHLLAAAPTATFEVSLRERPEQQFGLVA
jgi:hypothetical protein